MTRQIGLAGRFGAFAHPPDVHQSTNLCPPKAAASFEHSNNIPVLQGSCAGHDGGYRGGVTTHLHRTGLRSVALFEAFKGAVVLIAGFGVLTFLGHHAQDFAEQLVHRMHLNPARHYPQVFIHAMAEMTNAKLWLMAGFAAFYTAVRFTEAYGLWHERRWAEWFAVLSGGIYVPVEIYKLSQGVTWLKLAALVLNLAIVAYLARLLSESRRTTAATCDPARGSS